MRKRNLAAAVLSTFLAASAVRAAMTPGYLRTEYHVDPLGIDVATPRFSWVLDESDPAVRGQKQTACQIRVASDPSKLDAPDLWDTGQVTSDQQNQLPYAGRPLASGQHCWWQVRTWDKDGQPSAWSPTATWSMGLLAPTDWTAAWIGSPAARDRAGVTGPVTTTGGEQANNGTLRPPIGFRKAFDLRGPVRRATLYATAAGVFELSLNGRRISGDVLGPGWPEYARRVYYRTYDVTILLRGGAANAIGATVADGWWGLHHGGRGDLGLRLQLDVELTDGTHQTIGTDPTWRASAEGPIRLSDMYQGETYDARREQPGWDSPGFDDRDWSPAVAWSPVDVPPPRDVTALLRAAVHEGNLSFKVSNTALGGDPAQDLKKSLRVDYHIDGKPAHKDTAEGTTLKLTGATIDHAEYGASVEPIDVRAQPLSAHPGEPVRRTGEILPLVRTEPTPGTYVYDLGQNFTGWVRLRAAAPAGTTATLRFAEALNPDGTVYTTNLRIAACTDRYTFAGHGVEAYEPHFTFHGSRYVELTGLPTAPPPDAVTGVVVGSVLPMTSTFQCSDPLLNQLQRNIVWSQRGNYLEVPTDCPQRDERRGWSGDAQAFISTGAYNQDVAAFFTAWLRTYDDEQHADGGFANIAPADLNGGTSPGWGDAGVICPWTLYQRYGDTRVLAEGYPHMVRWIDHLKGQSKDLIRPKTGFGDWLSISADTPKDLIATAYFAHATDLVGRIAAVLGKPDDAAKYADLQKQIAAAFRKSFVTDDGHVTGETQTGYLLAVGFDLLEPSQRPVAMGQLQKLIHDRQDHLSVGFLGVNLLLPVLSDGGDVPLAYKLLENDTYPSWGYPIRHGATTVWERWNGWTADKGFADPAMNSFNHYAYGSCGQWIFTTLAGIAADQPGFAHVVIHPRPGGDVTFADATYDSIRGPVAVHWGLDGKTVRLTATVPPNVSATVYVPTNDAASVTEGDGPADQAKGVTFVRSEPGFAVYELGSGSYAFAAAAP